jgi:hypothetical protein
VTIDRPPALFGTANRTQAIVAVRLLGETWGAELAALLTLRISLVQTILNTFEEEGVLVSRLAGRSRLFSLNPRYSAARELRTLLWRLGSADLALQKKLAQRRRRPRRAGKAL